MVWDIIRDDIRSCDCGKGKSRYISEMDDWNRVRYSEYVDCKECYEKYLRYKKNSYSCPNIAKHDHTTYIYVNDVDRLK